MVPCGTKKGYGFPILIIFMRGFWLEPIFSSLLITMALPKIYHNMREIYWWNNMKRDLAKFPNYQYIKVEYLRPSCTSQNIAILVWKWEKVNIYFIIGLSHTHYQYESIWVTIDKINKYAHLFRKGLCTVVYSRYFRLHGPPVSIIYDRGIQFTS